MFGAKRLIRGKIASKYFPMIRKKMAPKLRLSEHIFHQD